MTAAMAAAAVKSAAGRTMGANDCAAGVDGSVKGLVRNDRCATDEVIMTYEVFVESAVVHKAVAEVIEMTMVKAVETKVV